MVKNSFYAMVAAAVIALASTSASAAPLSGEGLKVAADKMNLVESTQAAPGAKPAAKPAAAPAKKAAPKKAKKKKAKKKKAKKKKAKKAPKKAAPKKAAPAPKKS